MSIFRCAASGAARSWISRIQVPGEAWKLDQFWICLECGRHFWTTYTLPKTAYAILRPNGVRERYPRDVP